MAIRYDEPGVLFDDAHYTFSGAYLGAALVSDPCYRLAIVPRDDRVSRPRRSYRVVLSGDRGIG